MKYLSIKLKQFFLFLTASFTMIFCALVSPAGALSTDQLNALYSGVKYFNTEQCGSSSTNSGSGGSSSMTGPWAWNSGVQPPYFLESYVINILKDLAQAQGIPSSSTVTQEHVAALVAWTQVEGGNIANSNAFNIWNMGFMSAYPQLYANGTGNSDGTGTSFASFDAGVEANTILLLSSNQNRIGAALSKPDSTAEQVMHAIAYYDETPGNQAWAWGNTPSDPNSVLNFNHTVYINTLLQVLGSIRSNYSHYATLEIGPGIEGNANVPASQLTYGGGASNGTSASDTGNTGAGDCANNGSSTSCNNGQTTTSGPNAAILCEAEKYNGIFYLSGGGHQGYTNFRAACPETAIQTAAASSSAADPGPCATDCSGLVSVAIDAAYNQNLSFVVQNDQMYSADGNNYWTRVQVGDVQAGDIATTTEHVEIIDHYDSGTNTIYTFGSHHTGSQTSAGSGINYYTSFWRYTGPKN